MYEKSHRGEEYKWLNGVLTFDIETVPNMDMIAEVPPKFDAPSNYKDPEKIEAYVETKAGEFIDKAPLDVDYAQVHSIGLALGEGPIMSFIVGQVGHDSDKQILLEEHHVLTWFWYYVGKAAKLAGYNIGGFDLPIIQRRSWVLGVKNVRPLYNLKPWDPFILDIMKAFYFNGYGPGPKYRGLKEVARLFGIENPLPDLDGSQYKDLDPETQKAYLENDVTMTRELVRRTHGHFWG